MPPSPALRCSPGRESRANNHKRGHSFEGGLIFREKDDDLALFNEMQTRERENFLLQSSDDLEATFSTKLRHFSDIKLGISIPARGESSDLLNADGDKNDYDWLLTPPDTPLFPSLDDEPPQVSSARRGRPRSQPISISRSSTMEKSYRSSRGSASPNRLSPSPRSGSGSFQSRGRPSSTRQSSPSPSIRSATPSRRPSTPPSKPSTPVPRSSTPTPRRVSTGSGPSSGVRGISPVKTSRGNSASPKIRAWQTNIPGFSSEAPPNLRTSLADRPATYVRGSSPATRNGSDSSSKFRRQSTSPTASRSVSSSHSHERDPFSTHSKGSVASSGDDDVDSIHSMHVGSLDRPTTRRLAAFSNTRAPALSKKPTRAASPSSAPKRSFDYSAFRQMDTRKSPPNMFRPLLSSVPSTTFYVGKASSVHRSLISRNSSVTAISNASSDQGISDALDTEGSDHNQDDAASEFEKAQYSDVHEEVFAFDKLDVVDEVGHEVHNESTEMDDTDLSPSPKVEFGLAERAVTQAGPSSEAFLANDDFSEVDSLEIMAVCSRCGCRYHASELEETDIRLCPDCTMKDKRFRVAMLDTAGVIDTSPALSINNSQEEKPSDDLACGMAVPVLSQVTNVTEPKNSLDEENVEGGKTSYSANSHNYLQENSLARSDVERDEGILAKQPEEGQSSVGHDLPNNDAGVQRLRHSSDYPNLKVDISEGAGISVLLKRTNSSKGPVVRGRTFSAASIPYDDLSYAKDSIGSMRSSIGHGTFSASSSVDFSSRQTDSRVQRQLSGKKSEMEYCRNDKNAKTQSVGSSLSGIANLAHQAKPLSTSIQEDNSQVSIGTREYDAAQETVATSQDHLLASRHTEVDATDTSSTRTFVVEEDPNGRTVDASTAELRPGFDSRFADNVVESLSNNDGGSLHDLEFSKDARNVREIEALDTIPNVDMRDGEEVPTHSSTVTTSEIESEKQHHNPGPQSDNVSLASKSTGEEFLEASPFTPSDKEMIASTPDQALDILEEESTIMVECQKGNKARNLTLEEATDTILFCSSIVHDLAYQAATIAMEQEISEPLEGSRPTVTILGKSNYDKKDPPRGRTVSNRSSKSQKTRKKRLETDAKPPSTTENDENAVESLKRNVETPNKVDSLKPPKLESKCNCTIM